MSYASCNILQLCFIGKAIELCWSLDADGLQIGWLILGTALKDRALLLTKEDVELPELE